MLKIQSVLYDDGQGNTLQVTVSEATALMGMRRSVLVSGAIAAVREALDLKEDQALPEDTDLMARHFLRRYTYPNCLACVVEAEGLATDLPFEEFCNLPDTFVSQWEAAALELNPHWKLQAEEGEEEAAKKKEPDPEKSESGAD